MATASPKAALRPLLPSDVPFLAAIFRASIEDLTAEDYDDAQREAWAARAEDEEAFGRKLAGMLTLVATLEGSPVAFASLKGNDTLDMLYVFPAVARQGLASMLLDAMEKLSRARGAAKLVVDASDTAKPFFDRRGFTAQQRNVVPVDDQWLANTTMDKKVGSASSSKT